MKKNKLYSVLLILGMSFLIFGISFSNHLFSQFVLRLIEGESFEFIISREERIISENFEFKAFFVDFNGLIHKLTGQRYMNDVVLLDNGHGSSVLNKCSDDIIMKNAERLAHFSQWCLNENRTFTYVQIPYKNQEGNSLLPLGMVDDSNRIADLFGNELVHLGVDYLDLRMVFGDGERDFYDYFYKTEHHWNCFGGFKAFVEIVKYFEEEYNEQVDQTKLDILNYKVEKYSKSHSGYYSSKVGKYFLRPEDFYILYPIFETSQVCSIPHKNIIRKGSFYDAVFDNSFLQDSSIKGRYCTYIGGDFPLVIHESSSATNKNTILLFIDSFGTIPESFFTTVFERVVAVDLRWVLRNGWNEKAIDFVEQYNPNHVVVMFNPNQLIYQDSEQFLYGIE